LSLEDLARLMAYAAAGGGVALFGGGEMDRCVRVGLYPPVQSASDVVAHLSPGTADHPVFNLFRAGRNGDVTVATFARRLLCKKDPRWRPALLFDDGSPAAMEAVVGRGRILALSFALCTHWTDLPKFACFVPMAHELSRHLAGSVAIEREFSAGIPIFLSLPRSPNALDYVVMDLQNGTHENRRADPALTAIHVARALPPGRYAVDLAGAVRPFSVNVDATASDPTRLSHEDLVKRLPRVAVSFAFERAASAQLRDARSGRELALYALLSVVLILLGELWLASRA
jgi:hypothetical protein